MRRGDPRPIEGELAALEDLELAIRPQRHEDGVGDLPIPFGQQLPGQGVELAFPAFGVRMVDLEG